MNRRRLLSSAFTVAVAAGPAQLLAQSPSLQHFPAAATPIEGDALMWVAQSAGYFAREGIDLTIQSMSSGEATAAAIVGGDIVLGSMNTLSLATAHQNGIDLKAVAGGPLFDAGHGGSQVLVKKDSPINSGADLKGKTIAVNVLHGSAQISVEAWIDKHGGDAKTVNWVEMPFAAMQAALEQGRIDAGQVAQPWATSALTTCRSLGPPNAAIAPRFLVGAYVSLGSWVAAHRDAARRISTALSKCAHWYNTKPEESVQAVATLTKQDPAVVARSARSLFGESVTPALLQPEIDVGAKYGLLKTSFPASEIIAQI